MQAELTGRWEESIPPPSVLFLLPGRSSSNKDACLEGV